MDHTKLSLGSFLLGFLTVFVIPEVTSMKCYTCNNTQSRLFGVACPREVEVDCPSGWCTTIVTSRRGVRTTSNLCKDIELRDGRSGCKIVYDPNGDFIFECLCKESLCNTKYGASGGISTFRTYVPIYTIVVVTAFYFSVR